MGNIPHHFLYSAAGPGWPPHPLPSVLSLGKDKVQRPI